MVFHPGSIRYAIGPAATASKRFDDFLLVLRGPGSLSIVVMPEIDAISLSTGRWKGGRPGAEKSSHLHYPD